MKLFAVDFLKDGKRVGREYVAAYGPKHAQRIAEGIVTVPYDDLEVNPL